MKLFERLQVYWAKWNAPLTQQTRFDNDGVMSTSDVDVVVEAPVAETPRKVAAVDEALPALI